MNQKLNFEIFGYTVNAIDKFELINSVLTVVSEVSGNRMRPAIRTALTFYIIFGYSKETRDLIVDSLGINHKNLNQTNSILTKLGYLDNDPKNLKNKLLSPEMAKLKAYFVDEETPKIMMIKFKNVTKN